MLGAADAEWHKIDRQANVVAYGNTFLNPQGTLSRCRRFAPLLARLAGDWISWRDLLGGVEKMIIVEVYLLKFKCPWYDSGTFFVGVMDDGA